jgi:hypothetical protein
MVGWVGGLLLGSAQQGQADPLKLSGTYSAPGCRVCGGVPEMDPTHLKPLQRSQTKPVVTSPGPPAALKIEGMKGL